jgi:hypothetical protein
MHPEDMNMIHDPIGPGTCWWDKKLTGIRKFFVDNLLDFQQKFEQEYRNCQAPRGYEHDS